MTNKRRKAEEERGDAKRKKGEDGCDGSVSGQSESGRAAGSKSTGTSEPRPEVEEQSQSAEGPVGEGRSQSAEGLREADAAPEEDEEMMTEPLQFAECAPPSQDPIGGNAETQGCGAGMKGISKPSPAEHSGNITPRMQTPPDVNDVAQDLGRPQEGSGAAPVPQPSQEAERHIAEAWPASDCRSTERKPQLQDSCAEETAPPSSAQQCLAATPCVPNLAFPQEVRTLQKQSSSPDILRSKGSPTPGLALSNCASKRDPSPGEKQRAYRANGSAAAQGRGVLQQEGSGVEPDEPHPVFKPIALRGSASEPPNRALQTFTVYRDPALGRPQAEPSHIAYLHPLHQSPRSACLAPPSPHHPSHGLIHHPHLLPSMLPGLAQPSLLGAVGLAHHPHHQQQPPGPAGPSYNHLGLYPIVWQYPALGLPASKWGHLESSVSPETCLRRVSLPVWHYQKHLLKTMICIL